jgi:hypothetical protein
MYTKGQTQTQVTLPFLSNENVQMLWEVIIDDPTVAQNATTQQVFTRIVPEFYERERTKFKSLMEMNKQFIAVLVDLLSGSNKQQQQQQQSKTKITFEELQQERVSQFEDALSIKQQEFTQAMAVPLPPMPTFTDDKKDEPLSDMEKMIQQTIAERNLEMEKIQQELSKMQKGSNGDSWLKAKSTSIKEEKEQEKKTALSSALAPKTINIGKEIKEVTWADTTNIIEGLHESSQPLPFFSKLKVKDPLKELEDAMNARFDKLEQLLLEIALSKKD